MDGVFKKDLYFMFSIHFLSTDDDALQILRYIS